jgi:hypothetical protein
MASSSLLLVDNTHKQHKQKLVVIDGALVTVVPFVVTSPAPIFALFAFGSKFSVNKKQMVYHAKCWNPNLRLATKANACKVANQEGGPGITSHAPESAKSVRE